MGKPVASLAMAQAVSRELLATNLRSIPVGIAMNRLSEDGFHGKEHASLAHWIPDTAIPLTPDILRAEDAYLDNPTRATLSALDDAVDKGYPAQKPIDVLSKAKFRSLLVSQHELRIEVGMAPAEPFPLVPPKGNPLWLIGDLARIYSSADAVAMALPNDVSKAKLPGPPIGDQLQSMRIPWFWLGWTADPSLTHSGGNREILRADWFVEALVQQGYVAHCIFMLGRKLHEQSRPPGIKEPWQIQFSFLLYRKPLIELEPKDPVARAAFRRLAGNVFRSVIYAVNDEVKRTHLTVNPESQCLQMRLIKTYLRQIHEPEDKLIDETIALVTRAKAYGRGV